MDHEYALIGGYNRSGVGRWLTIIASVVSAAAVFVLLSVIDLAHALGMNVNLPPTILSLCGAGTVYIALYWIFDRYAWKMGPLGRVLRVPNLSGVWQCKGVSLDRTPPTSWTGKVTIVQSWDKLRVHVETKQSVSDSISAALLYDAAAGYRLMYQYRNHPRMGETELAAHHGFAELTFAPGEVTAAGDYFNGRGRNTYGTMQLRRAGV